MAIYCIRFYRSLVVILILDVHPCTIVVIRTRKLQAGEVVGILRVRRRAAQLAVADLYKLLVHFMIIII